jgi:hypothetical protein
MQVPGYMAERDRLRNEAARSPAEHAAWRARQSEADDAASSSSDDDDAASVAAMLAN